MTGERGVEQNDLIRKGKQKGHLWVDGKEIEQEDQVGVEAKEKLLGETAKIKGHGGAVWKQYSGSLLKYIQKEGHLKEISKKLEHSN